MPWPVDPFGLGAAADAPGDGAGPPPGETASCLLCHSFPGLSRLDRETGELRLFFVHFSFQAQNSGPHTRVPCTGCHTYEQVAVVPHGEVSPVDCGRACHLETGSGAPVSFRHEVPQASLAESVHPPSVLAEQPFAEPLLRPGQSACLYCHDDPYFAPVALADPVHRGVSPTVRCESCHGEGLGVDAAYYVKHVAGRLGAARDVREEAEQCAVCHSDEALNEANEKHDAVTSYLRSFHGKASALGSPQAATCVDCHSDEDGNPHRILAATDPLSPTHPDNRELTCRNEGCHPDGDPGLSEAAVHLRVAPQFRTAEYYVAVCFLLLTAGTMTVYFLLIVLEFANAALSRESEEQDRLVGLALAVQSDPVGRKRLTRLDVHQRFQHWAVVIPFLVLVVSGLPLKFANVEAMASLAALLGGVGVTRTLHRLAAVAISAAFLYHVGYLVVLGRREIARRRRVDPERPLLAHLAQLAWDFPMMIHPRDLTDFARLFAWLSGKRKERPAQGRFHFSQKFEYWAVFWGMTMIGVSGALLWRADDAARLVGGRALNFAYLIHSDEAFLAITYIAAVHFFAVVFSPSVFPLNLGSLSGEMPAVELAENHAGHLRAVAAELGITAPEPTHDDSRRARLVRLVRRGYSALQALFFTWVGWACVSFLMHELGGPERAVEIAPAVLHLDQRALSGGVEEVGGFRPNGLDRGPPAHFHAVPAWFSPEWLSA